MISIEKCNEKLKSYNYSLSNDEIKQVREFLYLLAELQLDTEKRMITDEECNIIL